MRLQRLPLLALLALLGCPPDSTLHDRMDSALHGGGERIEGPTISVLVFGERGQPPPEPTEVRVYQLADSSKAKAIVASSREELVQSLDTEVALGALSVQTFTPPPNGSLARKYKRHEKTRAVLVVALVRRPSGTSWRFLDPRAGHDPVYILRIRDDALHREWEEFGYGGPLILIGAMIAVGIHGLFFTEDRATHEEWVSKMSRLGRFIYSSYPYEGYVRVQRVGGAIALLVAVAIGFLGGRGFGLLTGLAVLASLFFVRRWRRRAAPRPREDG